MLKGFSHFKVTPGPRFSSALSFLPKYKYSVSLAHRCQNFGTPFDWLVFDILFHAWSTFEFHHMLANAFRIINRNRITKTLLKMLDKGSDFATFVTFVIFCVVQKIEIWSIVFKSRSSHNICDALVTNELTRTMSAFKLHYAYGAYIFPQSNSISPGLISLLFCIFLVFSFPFPLPFFSPLPFSLLFLFISFSAFRLPSSKAYLKQHDN